MAARPRTGQSDRPGGFRSSLASCGAFAVATLALLLPALANRYPLVMGDTWRYLQETEGTYWWVSSQFYAHFLRIFAGSSLWLVVLAQALLVLYVTDAFFRRICGAPRLQSLVLVTLLALTTPASFFASLVMTDVMFGVGLVAAAVLILGTRSAGTDVAMCAIVTFAAAAHPVELLQLMIVTVLGVAVVTTGRVRSGGWNNVRRVALLAAGVAGALLGLVVNNAVIWGKATPSPHGSVHAFGYLLTNGDLEDELADCRTWKVCRLREPPGRGINASTRFLFDHRSELYSTLGGPTEFAPEATQIILEHITSDPGDYARRILSSSCRQLFLVRSRVHMEWMMPRLGKGHSNQIAIYSEGDVGRFQGSREFKRVLDLDGHEDLGILVGWLGAMAATLGAVAWSIAGARGRRWSERRRRVARAALFMLGVYVLHAVVVSTSAYPMERYGARVLWLLGLAFSAWAIEGVRSFAERRDLWTLTAKRGCRS